MPYRYLPHTADVKFEATAPTIEEAFSEAADAFTHVMTEAEVAAARELALSIEAESKEALFFEFLDHLVMLLDTEGLFVRRADLRIVDAEGVWRLEGALFGDDASKYERHGDVKAPTYHDLAVERTESGWLVRATLDI